MPHIITRPGVVAGGSIALLLTLTHAVNDTLTAILGALLPTLEVKFAANPLLLALLVATFSISSTASQPVLGALADRIGLRQVAAVGVAVAAITLSLVAVAPTIILLIVLLVLGGLGSAALHPISTSIVGSSTAKRPGMAVGMFTAGGMIGFAAGPIIILALVSRFGTGATPWLMVPGIVLAVLVYAVLPDFEPHTIRGTPLINRRAFNRPTIILTLASTLVSLTFITFTSAVPLWLVKDNGLPTDAPLLGLALGSFSVAAAIGAVAGGVVAPRIGTITTTVASLIAAAIAFSTLLLVPAGTATLITGAITGFMLYASQPLLIVAAQALAPHAPTTAAGLVIGIGTGIAGLLYIGSGALQSIIGLTPAMQLNIVLLVPAALIAAIGLRLPTTHHTETESDPHLEADDHYAHVNGRRTYPPKQ